MKCLSTAIACCWALREQSTERQRPALTWAWSCGDKQMLSSGHTTAQPLPWPSLTGQWCLISHQADQLHARRLGQGCSTGALCCLRALTLWYGSPEVRMILPSCLANCTGDKSCGEGVGACWARAASLYPCLYPPIPAASARFLPPHLSISRFTDLALRPYKQFIKLQAKSHFESSPDGEIA